MELHQLNVKLPLPITNLVRRVAKEKDMAIWQVVQDAMLSTHPGEPEVHELHRMWQEEAELLAKEAQENLARLKGQRDGPRRDLAARGLHLPGGDSERARGASKEKS